MEVLLSIKNYINLWIKYFTFNPLQWKIFILNAFSSLYEIENNHHPVFKLIYNKYHNYLFNNIIDDCECSIHDTLKYISFFNKYLTDSERIFIIDKLFEYIEYHNLYTPKLIYHRIDILINQCDNKLLQNQYKAKLFLVKGAN